MSGKLSDNNALRAFLKGFASAFDITGGVKTPDLDSGFQTDYEALKGDWQRVGGDLRRAMDTVTHGR
jgi:hypothetical protein